METLKLVATLGRAEGALHGQELLAPLTGDGRARLRLSGLIYELAVRNARHGWWICRVRDYRQAEIVDEAQPWQRGEYLHLWPALRLVLLEPLTGERWLALPFSPSDAAQRFGVRGPLVVQLVAGGRQFDRVIGRVEGATIWFDDLERRAQPQIAEALRAALAQGEDRPRVAGLGAGERQAYAVFAARQAVERAATMTAEVEGRLRHALGIGGATLLSYEHDGDRIRVAWESAGQRSTTIVDAGLSVVSAGICLSGEDARFDLASVVGVVREAPDYARGDDWEED